MSGRLSAAAVLMLVIPAVVGCAAGSSADTAAPAPGPLVTYPMPQSGMDALLSGTLRLISGCVAVEMAVGDFSVPVFPDGDASWDADVLRWGGRDYTDGDAISLGGGFTSSKEHDGYVPGGCAGFNKFLVAPTQIQS